MTDTGGASLWHASGGNGRTVLLLHGLGATAAVWNETRRTLEAEGLRWLTADLLGHGASPWGSCYSVGELAAALAVLLSDEEEVFIVGHSLGAYVALALASGWFGVRVRAVLGIGPKVGWSADELRGARELAARPVRWYASPAEAVARYRRVAGLSDEIAADAALLERGVVQSEQGWRLAQDPRTFAAAGAPFATLVSSAAAALILARGEHDAMVSESQLQAYGARVHTFAGAGHNAHLEQPRAVAALLLELIRATDAQ